MTTTEEIASAVMRGKRKEVGPLVQRALDEGVAAQAILDEGLIAPMGVIGDRFSAGEAFVPEDAGGRPCHVRGYRGAQAASCRGGG